MDRAGASRLRLLRVHPGSFYGLPELSDHESDGCPAEEGQTVSVQAFPILGEATTAIEPADRSFNDPPLRDPHEALGGVGSLDDLHVDVVEDPLQPGLEVRPLRAAV